MLKFHYYQLRCTERGLRYFPQGIREGVLVELNNCLGEWAPLAGIHEHSMSTVIGQLGQLNTKEIIRQDGSFAERADFFKCFPYPASYILSMINYHNCIQKKAVLMPTIKRSALVLGDAEKWLNLGYQCLKIKIGNPDSKHDIDYIRTISLQAGKHVRLRLDANKKYSYQEALNLWQAISNLNIEYIEEPSYELDKLALLSKLGMPIALDESFCEDDSVKLLAKSKINYLVIKPSKFSSIYQIMLIAESCKKYGVQLIVSTCFESDFSHMIMIHLIDELGLGENFHGIFDQEFFKEYNY